MIFDWKNNKNDALKTGWFSENKAFGTPRIVVNSLDGKVSNHTFCNFEVLMFEDGTNIEDCIFELCGELTFDECQLEHCTFRGIDTIYATRSSFTNSKFCELVCDNDMIISLEDSKISCCSFEDIELQGDSYLCDGVGDSWIEHCNFANIRTSREDREIMFYEKTVGKVFKRKKQFSMVDEETCLGFNS